MESQHSALRRKNGVKIKYFEINLQEYSVWLSCKEEVQHFY